MSIMIKLLDDLDAKYLKGDISANQKIYDKFLDLELLEGIGDQISDELGLIVIERLKSEEKNYSQASFFGYDNNKEKQTFDI
ncbi:MAG TPA: hypothetical protein DIT39_06280 [Tissierellales bacterium]|nr:hypothetical protein [Tissierellales bacterium]